MLAVPQGASKDELLEKIKVSDLLEVTLDFDEAEIDFDAHGDYEVLITAKDVCNNATSKKFSVQVLDPFVEEENESTAASATQQGGSSGGGTAPGAPSSGGGSSSSGGNVGGAPTAPSGPVYRTDISNSYFAQIQSWQAENGADVLPWFATTQAIADRRAMELVSNYGHDQGDYSENIGRGGIGSNFFEAWKASPGHNAAMISPRGHTSMAVAVVEYDGMWYAVTIFGMN